MTTIETVREAAGKTRCEPDDRVGQSKEALALGNAWSINNARLTLVVSELSTV